MYGELRTALNNVASQFGQIALQLEESHQTKARAVINNVKKLHEIDDFVRRIILRATLTR